MGSGSPKPLLDNSPLTTSCPMLAASTLPGLGTRDSRGLQVLIVWPGGTPGRPQTDPSTPGRSAGPLGSGSRVPGKRCWAPSEATVVRAGPKHPKGPDIAEPGPPPQRAEELRWSHHTTEVKRRAAQPTAAHPPVGAGHSSLGGPVTTPPVGSGSGSGN